MKNTFRALIFFFVSISIFAEEQKLTVMLDWFVNPNHAPLFVAQQQGFYEKHGIKVTFITPADPSDPPKLVAAGKVDVAIDYQPALLLQQANNLPLVQIGTLIAQPLSCLGILGDGKIKSLADLRGKKIGYAVGAVDDAVLNKMLQAANLTTNDVELINVNYALLQALLSKKIDAVVGLMRNFETIEAELAGANLHCFYPEAYGFPKYNELILIANTNYSNKALLQNFLAAVQEGADYLNQYPEKSWEQFANNHLELNNELNRRAWFQTLPYFSRNIAGFDKSNCLKLSAFLNQQMKLVSSSLTCQSLD